MNSCATILRICRHILPNGRRCQQPAVRRRACCRHHLEAQARLHNMARARRRTFTPPPPRPRNLSRPCLEQDRAQPRSRYRAHRS
jgi:hypothetical protein